MKLALVLVAATAVAVRAAPAQQVIAVCSPGAVGTAADAQPALDAFAAAATAKSGVPLAAIYDETEAAGAARLGTAGLALVSLPFFLAHEQALGLHARLTAVQKGRPELEHWSLVAKKGRVATAAALAGLTIYANVAFAPAFVRGPVLGAFGALPASAKLVQSGSVLSSLRRAANGEAVAVILDGPQEAALATLPFAAQLEVVARSAPMPAGVLATVDAHLPAKTWAALDPALRALPADALAGIQLERFAPLDDKALAAARKAFADAAR